MEKAKQDVRFIKTLYYQERAFIVISEYINKPEHFDVEWFKIVTLTKQWQALIQKHNNITRNYERSDAFFKKFPIYIKEKVAFDCMILRIIIVPDYFIFVRSSESYTYVLKTPMI